VEKIKKENSDFEDKIIKVDIDEDATLAERFSVQSIPTLLFIKDGKMEMKKGNQAESVLVKWFD